MEPAQLVLNQLDGHRPEWVRGEVKLVSAGMPASLFGFVSVSAKLIEDGDASLLAFAIAYGLASDFFAQVMRGAAARNEPLEDKLDGLPEWLGWALALPLGPASLGASMVGTTIEAGEFERESIRRAARWVIAAGFDPRAGVRFFDEGFTALRDYREPKPSWKNKSLRAAFKPTELVFDRIRKGPEAFLTNSQRARFVEEICVEIDMEVSCE